METTPENYNWGCQGSTGCGDPSPSGYICSTAPASMAQGTSWKRGWKDCQSQSMRTSAGCLLCANKAWTIAIWKDRLMGKWGISQGLSPIQKKKTANNQQLPREEKFTSLRDEPPDWLSNMEWSALKSCIHTHTKSGPSRRIYIFVHIYAYIWTCM